MKNTIETAYTPEELRKLQLIELDIYKEFARICQKHNIQFFGNFGTLIGAVRHQGIIPWDDDIDVCLLKNDYDRLLSILPDELGDDYELINAQISECYPFLTSRIMRKGTEFRIWAMRNLECNSGIFLDIFCFNKISDDDAQAKRQMWFSWFYCKLLHLHHIGTPNLPDRGLKRYLILFACRVAHLILKLVPHKWLCKKAFKWAEKYEGTNAHRVANVYSTKRLQTITKISEIFPTDDIPFEDTTMPIPNQYDSILSRFYGADYMTPPPEGKRSFHIPYKLDFGEL